MQPSVILKVSDPHYVIDWLRQMFSALKLLKPNKLTVELVEPDDGRPYIKITRRG